MAKHLNAIPTKHAKLVEWVEQWAAICKPEGIYWCDGSKAEYDRLAEEMVQSGLAVRLNPAKKPNSLLFRSDPSDVARVENRTFIASEKQEDAGPTNNWIDPKELKKTMLGLYDGCMKGRILYVIPFSMGPVGSNIAKIGVELTDSAYVVNSISKGWMEGWKKNGWKKKGGVANLELWKEVDALLQIHNVTCVWVKGHASNRYNNECDVMAQYQSGKFL